MADRFDHAADAERLMAAADNKTREAAAVLVAAAQVRATLALVEQQRIANRIALAAVVAEVEARYGQHGARVGICGHEAALYDHPAEPDGTAPLRADIREGLGL